MKRRAVARRNRGTSRWRHRLAGSLLLALLGSLLLALLGCSAEPDYPWLDTLDAEDPKPAGKRLIALPFGLHRLDRGPTPLPVATVAVHGWRSEGYEWAYALRTLGEAEQATASIWFFRWDWTTCPEAVAADLRSALADPGVADVQRWRTIGHSLGGVVVAAMAAQWSAPALLEAHAIAAPLASVGEPCAYRPPTALPANVAFHQWRTQHALDGAFKDWPEDPQIVTMPGATTRLPATYRGRRLGHNWSVSWVADTLAGKEPPP